MDFSSWMLINSSIAAILALAITVPFPFVSLYLTTRRKNTVKTLKKYDALIEDFDISHKTKKNFSFFVNMKRLIFGFSVVLLYYIPMLQIIIPWACNIVLITLLVM